MTVSTSTRAVVVDTASSPYARLRPVPIGAVTLSDDFWAPRLRVNRSATLPSQYRLLWDTGRFDNLLRVAGKHDGSFQGRYFNDSDVYKWLEAASWALASSPDPDLEVQVEEALAIVEAAQQPDGYLNSYFALDLADQRWTDSDLHELYCAGHLFQAAVAHHRATGSRRLLDIATRFADYIDATFGSAEEGKRAWTDGHPEVEMALVELGRETGERRYVELAQFLVNVRGHGLLGDAYGRFGREYHQDHKPFRELDAIVGHAVRAVYLNSGVADLYAETGEAALLGALHRLWESMTGRKMYVSGGIGSRYHGESFGEDYELPNALAYAETCAAIGNMMWNWRMLLIKGDARYADLMELTLYNGMLAGVSLDGATYFYENPLADEGHHRRQVWFGTACCPPNVARTLAALPGYFYSVSDDGVWVHNYASGAAEIALPNGRTFALRQETRYPWDGNITVHVQGEGDVTIMLRAPGWVNVGNVQLAVNGESVALVLVGGYAAVRRNWRPGDTIQLEIPMPTRRVEAHPNVEENTGRIALMRGPLLYCVEQTDNPGVALTQLTLPDDSTITANDRPDVLGGVVTLTGQATVQRPDDAWSGRLYREADAEGSLPAAGDVSFTAIPYHAWANREAGPMRVWLRRGDEVIGSRGVKVAWSRAG